MTETLDIGKWINPTDSHRIIGITVTQQLLKRVLSLSVPLSEL